MSSIRETGISPLQGNAFSGLNSHVESTILMDEHSALEVIAVRAIETQDRARAVWSDADRAWASRASAEIVGEKAGAEAFVAKRGSLVMERFAERDRIFLAAVRGMRWHPWHGWILVFGAFILGFVIDHMGGSQRVDLLAPPVLGLISWNALVYSVLLSNRFSRIGKPSVPGLLRTRMMRLVLMICWRNAHRSMSQVSGDNVTVASIQNLVNSWLVLAKPLYAARIERILHLAAAALALGVILGFYVRGLAFEYRATWESTFLSAPSVHALLSIILAPGAWLSGIPIPDTAHIQSIHAPANENAAAWLHLFAASVLLIVLIPRIALASYAGYVERKHARNFPVNFEEHYFQHLLRGYHAEPVRVRVVPFSYTLPEAAQTGLELIVARSFGGGASLMLEPPVRWDDDGSAVRRMATGGQGPIIVLFNLTATPENEVHGAFIKVLKDHIGGGHALIAVVDESAFHARWPDDEIRIEKRRRAWDDWLASHHLAMVFVNLVAPDLQAVDSTIDAMLTSSETGVQVIS